MAPGELILIEGDNRARFPDCNALFVDDEIPTVIDPATRADDLARLDREKSVRLVINTHYHVDHTRYNSLFGKAEYAAHRSDAPAVESLDNMVPLVGNAEMPWVEGWKKAMRRFGYTEVEVAHRVTGGMEMSLGENTIRFIHTPGHTPGHLCVEFVENKAVYLGDIDLGRFGPWYGNLASSIDDFIESIERLKGISADAWFTAHGRGIVEGDIRGRLEEFEAVIYERDRRILDFLDRPRTVAEIIARPVIHPRRWDPPQLFEFFEGMMAGKHLARLERLGLVIRDGDLWSRT